MVTAHKEVRKVISLLEREQEKVHGVAQEIDGQLKILRTALGERKPNGKAESRMSPASRRRASVRMTQVWKQRKAEAAAKSKQRKSA